MRNAAYRLGLLGAALVTQVCAAQAPTAPPLHGQAIEISNCAGGPSISVGAADARAVLDDAEREALVLEMTTRYPVLERDGFTPATILLWRKANIEWIYISMRPSAPTNGTLCFTATFVAAPFRLTPVLMRKYF